jgi:hypothetical protein
MGIVLSQHFKKKMHPSNNFSPPLDDRVVEVEAKTPGSNRLYFSILFF